MKKSNKNSPEKISEMETSYFGMQAYFGVTNHMGGTEATRELSELCQIDEDKYVLDVGCGTGNTVTYLAKEYGCRVVGIDISEKMIQKAGEKAKKEELEEKIEFRVGTATDLPFENDVFDAVICESVNAFLEEKEKAVEEYVRVTKPGGFIGLNECTWLKTPPEELEEYMSHALEGADFLTPDGWQKLLKDSKLEAIEARTYEVTVLSQWINEMKQSGYSHQVKAWGKFLFQYMSDSDFREYAKELWPSTREIWRIFEYMGYGIYVGRKHKKGEQIF